MQKRNSPSVAISGLLTLIRALCVFFGGTFIVHWLARTARVGLRTADGEPVLIDPYFSWLGDALRIDPSVSNALGKSMFLGVAAIISALVLGSLFGGLVRIPKVGRIFGALPMPSQVLFVPGILLFPLANVALDQDWIPAQALASGQPFSENIRFIGFWGLMVGLALLPSVAALVSGATRARIFGLPTIDAASSARTELATGWRFGLPTTVFGLAMASAEFLSGFDGLFGRFGRALQAGDLSAALDHALVVILAGALIAAAVDIAAIVFSDNEADEPIQPPVSSSRLLYPLFGLLALVAGLAGAGFAIDGSNSSTSREILANPTFDGPWLGTDAVGRSLLSRVAEAIGPALVAALVPGLIATALGFVVAALRRSAPFFVDRFVGALVDALSWSLPIVVPLIAVYSNRQLIAAEFQVEVLGLTGLALTPMAARLISRSVLTAEGNRSLRLTATALYSSAMAFAAYLLAGFLGLHGNGSDSLGELVAEGITSYADAPWPLLAPSIAAALIIGLLYFLASAVATPAFDRVPDLTDEASLDRTSILEGVVPEREEDNDLTEQYEQYELEEELQALNERSEIDLDEFEGDGERIMMDAGAKADLLPASSGSLALATAEAKTGTRDSARLASAGVFAERATDLAKRPSSVGSGGFGGSDEDASPGPRPSDAKDERSDVDSDSDADTGADDTGPDSDSDSDSELDTGEAEAESADVEAGDPPSSEDENRQDDNEADGRDRPIDGPPPMPTPIDGQPPMPGGAQPPMPGQSFSLSNEERETPDTDAGSEIRLDEEPLIDIDAVEASGEAKVRDSDSAGVVVAAAKANELMDSAVSEDNDGLFEPSKTVELRPSTVREAQEQTLALDEDEVALSDTGSVDTEGSDTTEGSNDN